MNLLVFNWNSERKLLLMSNHGKWSRGLLKIFHFFLLSLLRSKKPALLLVCFSLSTVAPIPKYWNNKNYVLSWYCCLNKVEVMYKKVSWHEYNIEFWTAAKLGNTGFMFLCSAWDQNMVYDRTFWRTLIHVADPT